MYRRSFETFFRDVSAYFPRKMRRFSPEFFPFPRYKLPCPQELPSPRNKNLIKKYYRGYYQATQIPGLFRMNGLIDVARPLPRL